MDSNVPEVWVELVAGGKHNKMSLYDNFTENL